MKIKRLDKPNICIHLEPEIHDSLLIAWYCENCEASEKSWLCPHIGDETIWCPLRAHGVTSQTVEDDTTHWEIDDSLRSTKTEEEK